VTVIQTCTQCGAVNKAEVELCCFCDARLSLNKHEDIPVFASLPPRTEGNLATAPEPDWHSEVTHRLEAYRARRRRLHGDSSQPEFPFEKTAPDFNMDASEAVPAGHAAASLVPGPMPPAQPRRARPRGEARSSERLDIDISQPAFAFPEYESNSGTGRPLAPGQSTPFYPVASLSQRRRAGLWDAALLLFAFGGFWALFSAMGGHFTLTKLDAAVTAATLGLLYIQYFSLFSYFGGATPGMMLCRLRVVAFDGSEPTSRQLLWRSFGYLVSAGTAALGFFWALWDEDHLTWQDRISQTYITAAPEDFLEHPAAGVSQHTQRY
jgi:uncharacterized RDD family membrane protein YckC